MIITKLALIIKLDKNETYFSRTRSREHLVWPGLEFIAKNLDDVKYDKKRF